MLIAIALYVVVMLVGALDFSLASVMLSTRAGASKIMRRRRFTPTCRWCQRWARNASRALRYAPA